MIPTKAEILFLVCIATTPQILARAAVGTNELYDVYGNTIDDDDYKKDAPKCCIIPTCSEGGTCYQTFSCGYICGKGIYKEVPKISSRGYRKRNSFTKYECRFQECHDFIFDCSNCPDPTTPDFSLYTVIKNCRECYY